MHDRILGSSCIGLLVLAALIWPPGGVPALASPFIACEKRFAADPTDPESTRCFYNVAEKSGLRDEAAAKLESLLDHDRQNPWLYVYLGRVLRDLPRVEELLHDALNIAESRGETDVEVEARLALTRYLARNQRLQEADEALAPAIQLAERSGNDILKAKVRVRQAKQDYYQGRRLDYSYHLLDRVCGDLPQDAPRDLDWQCLDARYLVCYGLGRFDEARSCKESLLAMALEAGDLSEEASARYELAILHAGVKLPTPAVRRDAPGLFEAALAAARKAKLPWNEGMAHLYLGQLRGGDEGRRHLESCGEIAEARDAWDLRYYCKGALAASLVGEAPVEARRLMQQALADALKSPSLWSEVYGSTERLIVQWATLPRPEAIADSLEVLDAIEALRESQVSGSGRADFLSAWAEVYYWLSGRLLDGTGSVETADHRNAGTSDRRPREDVELAFTVTERMRARVLLEALEAARAVSPPASAAHLIEQRSEVLERMVEIKRRLLDPRVEPKAGEEAIAELKTLESEERELEILIAQASPAYAALRAPDFATVDEVEGRLDEDEALLSFQIGLDEDVFGRFGGGAWLLVSTRNGTRSYRLPADRVVLKPALDLVLRREELEDVEADLARLHQLLLETALADLPPGIERLVIIPDGELYRLPFALLPPAAGDEPLIARYRLSVVPSATLWLRWRSHEPMPSTVPALAFADPAFADPAAGDPAAGDPAAGDPAAASARVRRWSFAEGAELERLSHARKEGRTVVRTLGGGSRLLMDAEATERSLKEVDLRRYGLLHFAAHAVINSEVPQRSAVLLAPGAEDEDGWLQPRDIVELDLDGRLVVLANCESAGGKVLRGEGPMSLARAFFQAGSPVVVASLWPLQDEPTAKLFKEFYRQLARGTSVAESLAVAQRQMLRRGASARAWAGLVVLGNGDLVPFPGGLSTGPPGWVVGLSVVLALAALFLLAARLLRRVRHRRRGPRLGAP